MYGNDNEFYKGLSETQKRKARVQVCYVLKSLVLLEEYFQKG